MPHAGYAACDLGVAFPAVPWSTGHDLVDYTAERRWPTVAGVGCGDRIWARDMADFELRLYEEGNLRRRLRARSSVEVGRQRTSSEPSPFALYEHPQDGWRLIVGSTQETSIPRRWFRLTQQADGAFEIHNLHASYPVTLADGTSIAAGRKLAVGREPLVNVAGGRVMRVLTPQDDEEEAQQFRSLRRSVDDSDRASSMAPLMTLRTLVQPGAAEAGAESFVNLLRQALRVVREAAGSDAFFQTALDAARSIVGLDRAVILLTDDQGNWITRSQSPVDVVATAFPEISDTLLQRVSDERCTQIYDADKCQLPDSSLAIVNCAVAAPVLDHQDNIVAVLYGDRSLDVSLPNDVGISDVEATLVEVLAGAVAAGIARQGEEQSRARLAEFFSPRVAEQLAQRPELLTGQDAEVTVLFCDIRGFSSVAERIGPTKTIEWLNDVLTELSECVVDRDGVLIDYVGDQVMAMWGAPQPQPNHAERGIAAAAEMLQRAETLRHRWQSRLPRTFDIGIGLNTGIARVGNTGSRLKFKYGVLGNTVNTASRLQDASKQLGVDCVAAAATVEAAKRTQGVRRLARLAVVGIDTPVEVFEVISQPDERWQTLRGEYEAALDDFESQRFGEATRRLGQIVQNYPNDRPSLQLLRRAVAELSEPSASFCPVWKLTSK